MGLLDYFKTLNQPNQQGLTFVDRASMNPLLQAGIGILANNTGNYGQFGPAVAKGLGYGLQNVMGYQQNKEDAAIKKAQQDILKYDYETRRKKVEQEGMDDLAAQNQAKYMFKSVGLDFDNLENDVGGFMPVSATPQPIGSNPLAYGQTLEQGDFAPQPTQRQPSKLNALFDSWGWSPEERDMFAGQAQADPKAAAKLLRDEMIMRRRAEINGKKESRDVIAKDRVIAQEMGISLKDYYTMKNRDRPQAQIINYGTSFTPAVDAQGNPVLLQPSKTGGQPNVVQGFMPADDAEKARKSQSSARARMSSIDRLDADIDEVMKLPGLEYAVGLYSAAPVIPGTSQADAVAAIENLASRAAVQAISDMREASKTGGAVGQVTEKEWPKLEAQLANLNRKQSLPKFKQELQKFQALVRNTKRLIEEAESKQPRIPTQQAAPKPQPAQTGTVRKYNPATGRIE